MTDGDNIAQVAVVVLLLGLAIPALATAHDYAGTPFDYEDELTVDYDQESSVPESATDTENYGENVTVTVNGSTLTEGDDYTWNSTTGNVTWINTTATSDGDTATVSYTAYQRTGATQAAWQLNAPLWGLFGLFGLVASIRALWQYIAEVWELS